MVGRGHCLQVISLPSAEFGEYKPRYTFKVGDSWQYLFCLKPRPEHNNKSLKLVTAIGKLDMVSPEEGKDLLKFLYKMIQIPKENSKFQKTYIWTGMAHTTL